MKTLSFALLFLLACSGSSTSYVSDPVDGGAAGTGSLTGTWKGTWSSVSGQRATGTFIAEQVGNQVTGTVEFSNSPCASLLKVVATVHGDEASGEATAGDNKVTFEMNVFGDRLGGTYESVSLGACTGDTGTLEFRR